MENYLTLPKQIIMDKESLYWIFSTASQTLAAFIGLLFAGSSFIYNKIDSKIEKDSTYTEIYEEYKKNISHGLIHVLSCAIGSIAFDIVYLFTIPILTINQSLPYTIVLLLLNIYTIIYSIFYVYKIMNPNVIHVTIDQLSKELETKNKKDVIPAIEFVKHFIEFEKILRSYDKKYLINDTENLHLTLRKIIDKLIFEGIINSAQRSDIYIIIQLRNLILHGGEIENIEKKYDTILQDLTSSIQKELDKKNN